MHQLFAYMMGEAEEAEAPVVTDVDPNELFYVPEDHGYLAVVTITGTGFTGATDVTIGGYDVVYAVINDTTIEGSVDFDLDFGYNKDVVVTTPAGVSTGGEDLFVYYGPAAELGIDASCDPDNGAAAGGTSVGIYGNNLDLCGVTGVTFGGVSASFAVVGSHIEVTTPAGTPGLVNVAVTATWGGANKNMFTYT